MEIKKYKNIKEAIEEITKDSTDYIFVRHVLNPEDKIRLHYHKKADEFIVIDNGNFKVRLEDEERIFDLKDQTIVIYLPSQQKHTLSALSKISYFVLRNLKDVTIYCD